MKKLEKLVDGAVRTLHGRNVTVDVHRVEHASSSVALATAVCGETTIEMTHNFGPNDGGFGPMPDDHIEKSMEALQERATRAAAFHEDVRQKLKNYKAKA